MLFASAPIWLSTALGLAAKSIEIASNTLMFLTLLPFQSSGFVPASTMPAGLPASGRPSPRVTPGQSPSPRAERRDRRV